ncbi:MAG: response regulator transcription factor [Defluviitaleaceae bacterium]|nr:response regulator transcription factor [Defluviitaleaceae bacterium]MCL2274893.1 response regulator transcription factor [Defluviitaleaceae bacterium]
MTVLIAEDTAILRMTMKNILIRFCGITSDCIHEAEDGIQAIKTYNMVQPDIAFMDISMPKINGEIAIKQLLSIDPNAKIIILTGSRDERDVIDCIKSGATDYLLKPLLPKRVQDAIRRLYAATPDLLPPALR